MSSAASPVNLSDTAFISRFIIKYGAFVLVFLIVGRVALNLTTKIYRVMNPPKPPGPTMGFGTLPELEFPQSISSVESYKLEATTAGLTVNADQLPIFFIPIQKIGLFSSEDAKEIAANLGFVFPPEEISQTMYRWKKSSPLPAVLEMDIITKQFTMKTDWASDTSFLVSKSLPSQTAAITSARSLLKKAGLLQNDIATSEAKLSLLKASGAVLSSAMSISETDFLRVDISRNPIGQQFPILRSDPSLGNAMIIFSGHPDKTKKVIELSYSTHPIEYEGSETYPLITPQQAWETLQAGKGYIAMVDRGTKQAVIRKVFLAYFDSDEPQHYLQPIYVFSGDNNFYAYVSAVSSAPSSSK